MNENVNSPAKWLQYLLYVGIAAMANSLLAVFLPGRISTWIGYAASAASVYLFFRLIGANARYKTAAIFSGAAVIIRILGIPALSLAASISALVGQYQEYHAHGELVAQRDPGLAGKWSNLFFIQLGASILLVVMSVLSAGLFVGAAEMNAVVITAIITVVTAVITMILKVLYLVYLNRTIKAVETEYVV